MDNNINKKKTKQTEAPTRQRNANLSKQHLCNMEAKDGKKF